jgi:hypothetical protein
MAEINIPCEMVQEFGIQLCVTFDFRLAVLDLANGIRSYKRLNPPAWVKPVA